MAMAQKLPRQLNFEVLRVIAMIMVITLHYWSFATTGRSVEHDAPATLLNYVFLQPYIILCHAGVPIYFMISGYFLSVQEWKFKWNKFITVWFYALLYGVLFCLICLHNTPTVQTDPKSIIKSILPLTGNTYWFITIYLALSLFAPFLAKLSQSLSRKHFIVLLCLMTLFGMTFWFGFPFGNAIGVGNGFTLLYAFFLFMVGAYIRKYDVSLRGKKTGFIFWGTLLFCFCFVFITETLASGKVYVKNSHYNDLSVLVAIVLFIIIKDWKPKETGLTRFIIKPAPYVLGVYLIHENIYIREHLWSFVDQVCNPSFSSWLAIPYVLIIPVLVFICCTLLSATIQWLCKITHIEEGLFRLSGFLDNRIG